MILSNVPLFDETRNQLIDSPQEKQEKMFRDENYWRYPRLAISVFNTIVLTA